MEVIPAINCETKECAMRRLASVKTLGCKWIHVDVTDGIFSTHPTWNDATTYTNAGASLEVHFMVQDPERFIEEWLHVGAKRIIVHVEALIKKDEHVLYDLRAQCSAYGATLMLSQNPETSIEAFFPYLHDISSFQLLAVTPGLSGQSFNRAIIEKIRMLIHRAPHVDIEVDGGVNPIIARDVLRAGATIVSAASYIWESEDMEKAYRALQEVSI